MKNYNINDYELLYLISENNEDAFEIILNKYNPLIVSIAIKYFYFFPNLGLTKEDFIQEGKIGLYKATKTYKPETSMFYTLALACINNSMKKLIQQASCGKQKILNNAVSLELLVENDINNDYDIQKNKDLANIIIDKEKEKEIIYFKNSLSELNSCIFELKINGFNYKEIAVLLDISLKKVDNCLLSIRRTSKKYLSLKS